MPGLDTDLPILSAPEEFDAQIFKCLMQEAGDPDERVCAATRTSRGRCTTTPESRRRVIS